MARASRPRSASKRKAKPRSKRVAARLTARRQAVSVAAPQRGSVPAKTYTSKPVAIDFAGPEHRFVGADLEIRGIYHGEASYEGRIFFNNPRADDKTPRTPEYGYAGSFHIFGHGGCLGDPGHCDVHEHSREPYDFRPPPPSRPQPNASR
jgi:hypothetical protein